MNYQPPHVPSRSSTGHKGTFGTLLVVGGHHGESDVVFGGVTLAGLGALRAGIGQCIFAMPDSILHDAISLVPQATGFLLSKKNMNDLSELLQTKVDCILIGPALGDDELQVETLKRSLASAKPIIVDADGLNIIAKHPDIFQAKQSIITPHPVEFERLISAFNINEKNTDVAADALSVAMKTVVVLKNSRTYITNGEQSFAVDKPNSALAAAGSGDILSGIIAGLVTQYYPHKLSLFDCAVLGVQTHARAGELWVASHGSQGVLISELAELIPKSIDELR